jgi:hypothetical protein
MRPLLRIVYPLLLPFLLAAGVGCNSVKTNIGSAGQYNNYAATQGVTLTPNPITLAPANGGVWSLRLDDTSQFFSYEDYGVYADPSSASIGSFAGSGGFLTLTLNGQSSGSAGYGLEIPGSAALFRPGDQTNFPVFAVGTNSCPSSQASTTFQFVAMSHPRFGNNDTSLYPAYGSVQISAQGAKWNFANLTTYTVDGTSLNPSAISAGTCAYTQVGYAITVPTSQQTGNVPITAAVSPSGIFMIDLGQNTHTHTGIRQFGLVGVARPSAPLNTGSLVAGKYLGFEYVPLENSLISIQSPVSLGATTAPVAFGQTAGSGTVMTGGAYPNDDVTQAPPSNISIDLGAQDAQNNGLYKSVTVTIPDPAGACVSHPYGGTDANSNPTCIFPGVAVAGNPNNKYALFVTADDKRALAFTYTQTPIEFFLYQQ